ncbi:dual specificity protein phosphatase, putative [Entamoeba invadens IP1]|uniref:Dual specificity protein phosphatase, putative n=1 Tax=Entamoeba invadens IP1 TaxID=370355 RepID=A0A0A1U535_ENTIV|nr:dual specificity protein phosphatase, putative [Entamoeba invadens IP1]ELP86846.1 dual specificity protein phosphatase, putative [Entamoeba invadens IP1]|eukprot:XP_004253617.1 dual specificity protein phosphatase, putative [Entamoeba invadens IP1]
MKTGHNVNASKKKLSDGKLLKFISCDIKQHKITSVNVKTVLAIDNILTFTPSLQILTNLNTLDLSYNKITQITNDFGSLTSLTYLNLSNNKITSFTNLSQLVTLKSLILSFNQIDAIPLEQISKLTSLSELDLSWNKLEEFDYDCLAPLRSIEKLNVCGNRITTILHMNPIYLKDFWTPFSQVIPSCILPHLYLGSVQASVKSSLREFEIEGVLSIGTKPLYVSKKVEYYFIDCGDMPSDTISPYFLPAFDFIDKFVSTERNVLVHCVQGVSRSASLVVAYLMKKNSLPLEDALQRVKEKRTCASPNSGFLEQLSQYKP